MSSYPIFPMDEKRYHFSFKLTADEYIREDTTNERNKFETHLGKQIKPILELFNSADYKKFLVVSGEYGSGKTSLMKIIGKLHRGTKNHFRVIESGDIILGTEKEGRGFIDRFKYGKLCINDYGFNDKQAKHYGNSIRAIEELVYRRWEVARESTMFTTNIQTEEEFLSTFDIRVQQRIKWNLDWKYLTGKNYRIK